MKFYSLIYSINFRCKGELLFTILHSNKKKSLVDPVLSLALATDDTTLYIGLKRTGVIVMDIVSGQVLRKFSSIGEPVYCIALVEDNENKYVLKIFGI